MVGVMTEPVVQLEGIFHGYNVRVLERVELVSVQSSKDRSRPKPTINYNAKGASGRERLRNRHRPDRVQILFVGESPPASGRFFYQADSGLYRAVRETFVAAIAPLAETDFLDSFRSLGCYLVDLCSEPVDKMPVRDRRRAWKAGETRLARTIRALQPKIIVTVVHSIRANVRRAQQQAGWSGIHLELPYPGRWRSHQIRFRLQLVPLLRKTLGKVLLPHSSKRRKDRTVARS